MIEQVIAAFIATYGFGLLFRLSKEKLFFSAMNGVLSWFIYLIFAKLALSTSLTFFISSVSMTVYSEIMARKLKTPATILLIGGFIPLVPGSGVYYTMYGIITNDTVMIVKKGIQTLTIAGSITIGIFFGITLYNLFYKLIRRRIEYGRKNERENTKNSL